MCGQAALNVDEAERQSGLAQVMSIGAQDGDARIVEPGEERQTVEAVVFGFFAQQFFEQVDEALARWLGVKRVGTWKLYGEIGNVQRAFGKLERLLGEDGDAEVFQYWQDGR